MSFKSFFLVRGIYRAIKLFIQLWNEKKENKNKQKSETVKEYSPDFFDDGSYDTHEQVISALKEVVKKKEQQKEQIAQYKLLTKKQKKALDRAKDYLEYDSFSYSGLIEQLEFDGYTNDDAKVAVDNCKVNWKSEALQSAKDYFRSDLFFSRKGLINQLEYDGYTNDQATYAADNCGTDWNDQTLGSIRSYLEIRPFSKEEMIEQLQYDGYTDQEIAYGINKMKSYLL